jgi:hypothetical protein
MTPDQEMAAVGRLDAAGKGNAEIAKETGLHINRVAIMRRLISLRAQAAQQERRGRP